MDKRSGDKVIVWIFLGLIAVMSIASAVLPQKAFSDSENRYLQEKPSFTAAALVDGSFGKRYETYLSDQFPGRNGWIGVKVGTERLMGKTDVNGVYFGTDGYLMEQFEEEDIRGELLEQNLASLSSFASYAAERYGTDHMRILLAPSASQIMIQKLPWLAAPYDQRKVTGQLQDLLTLQMGAADAARLLVSVEDALIEQADQDIYYRTDHHWTAKGAYVGYRSWAQSAGLEPWEEKAFDVETVSDSFHGTIYSKVNVPWIYDNIELYHPKEVQDYQVIYDQNGETQHTLYSRKALEGRDKYAVYLDGNHGITEITHMRDENLPTSIPGDNAAAGQKGTHLLILKDSFAHSFAPFAANHYETVTMVDLRYMNIGLRSWMEQQTFTDVLVLYQIPGFAKDKNVGKLSK